MLAILTRINDEPLHVTLRSKGINRTALFVYNLFNSKVVNLGYSGAAIISSGELIK